MNWKKDKGRVILTADKGMALVVMDKADYNKKAEEVLNNNNIQEDFSRSN